MIYVYEQREEKKIDFFAAFGYNRNIIGQCYYMGLKGIGVGLLQ